MNKNDRIIENINATMSMEDMELSQEDKKAYLLKKYRK